MEYAYPYLLLVLAFGILAVCGIYYKSSSEKTTYINVLSIILFVFFFGLRGYVAYDWTSYCPEFYDLPDLHTMLTLPIKKWTWEPGFMIFGIFCKWIYPNYLFFQFVISLLNAILLFRFFRKYVDNIPFALLHQKNSTTVSSFVEEHFLIHLMSCLILIVQFQYVVQ